MLLGDNSSTVVADSENVYRNLIGRLIAHRIEKDLLAALDPDVAKVYQIGSLDFDTLQSLDHSNAENYPWPGSISMSATMKNITGYFGCTLAQEWKSKVGLLNITSSDIPLAEVVYIITYGMCPADKTFFVRWFRSRTSGVQ